MWDYASRPSKLTSKHQIGGDRPAKVYEVGRHTITVYDDGEVTAHQPYGYRGDPQSTLPNMEIIDGQIRIAMEDLIDQVLERIEPEELAVTLWANDEVRDRFMEALAERYSQDNIGDKDRRKFLDKVKEAVHSEALDKLASAVAKMEYDISSAWSAYRTISDCNQTLQNYAVRKPNGDLLQLKDVTNCGEFSIGGKVWNEARDHWRDEVRTMMGWKSDCA